MPFGKLPDEVLDEQGDVGCPLPERGDGDRDDLQPMVEVAAKRSRCDGILQVAVRGRKNPHVHTVRGVGADAGDLPRLEHPQQFDLRRHRHVANLVEKQRATVGVFELADPVAGGIGERTPHMAEQFTLQNVLAERRAVESHEGLALAGAVLVDGLGHEFLARARLPLDQHRGIGWSDPLEPLDQSQHLRTRSDDALEAELLVEPAVEFEILPLETNASRGLLDSRPEVGEIKRFLQVGKRPLLHRGDRRGDGAVAGHHDHLGLGRRSLRTRQDFETTDVVHHQIRDHDVERFLLDLPGPLRAAAHHHDLIVEPTQHLAHGAGVDDVVVDNQHTHERLQPGGRRWGRGGGIFSGLIHDAFDGTKPPFGPSSCPESPGLRAGGIRDGGVGTGARASRASTVGSRGGAGSQIVTLVPRPGVLSISIDPPCASTIFLAVGRPSPDPPCLVV